MIDLQVEYVPVPAITAKGIEYLDKLATKRSPNGFVETETDWRILKEVVKVWRTLFPLHAKEFYESAHAWKTHNDVTAGIIKEHGGALIQHQLEVPQKLYQMIETMFPLQSFDKEFVRKFMSELPEFNVTKLN